MWQSLGADVPTSCPGSKDTLADDEVIAFYPILFSQRPESRLFDDFMDHRTEGDNIQEI